MTDNYSISVPRAAITGPSPLLKGSLISSKYNTSLLGRACLVAQMSSKSAWRAVFVLALLVLCACGSDEGGNEPAKGQLVDIVDSTSTDMIALAIWVLHAFTT